MQASPAAAAISGNYFELLALLEREMEVDGPLSAAGEDGPQFNSFQESLEQLLVVPETLELNYHCRLYRTPMAV
ncbi:hypothetical protein [Bradyrhizobium valentinum]|uniref:hypothetical protein n=1 Tax=Bradyrhizobium valentinum TaxID=1518501 RepID=UPI00070F237F|nr:hypothetical protein [Bradyrhizobium valentinum]KRQ94114.1 hypothetical protein CQ10_34495 [Bradyrhizobium valentinum]